MSSVESSVVEPQPGGVDTWIQTEINGPVARITINRPEVHNAFNDEMIARLTTIFQDVGQQSQIRVIILAAEGKTFSAGADLNWMKRMKDYTFEENVADAKALSQLLFTIRDCPKPVIARIHGHTFGGGVGLVAACDLAVALEKARFCLSEVKLGLAPAVIAPFVYEKLGHRVRRYALTAEQFSAKKAMRMGLIQEKAETLEELDEVVVEWVEALVQNGPEAVSATKALFRQIAGTLDDGQREHLTTETIARLRSSEEGQGGMAAFLNKEAPPWRIPTAPTEGES